MANDLDLTLIADGQADDQWQSSNDGLTQLGNALADIYASGTGIDFSAGNVTLTSAQYRSAMVFKPSAALAAVRTLTLPAVKRPFIFHNPDATYTVTLKSTDGGSPEVATTIAVGPGQIFYGYTNGSSPGLFGSAIATGVAPSGDVVGPSSVTDGNPAVFDGTTGKLIKQRTFTQFTASLIAMVGDSGSGGTKGLVPAPGSGDAAAGKFLKADGTFAVPAGTAISTGKQTIWIPASAMKSAATNGPATGSVETSSNKVNFDVLDFDATTAEQAWFNIAMPKSWDESTVTFQAWWTTSATDTDGVAISLAGVALSDNEALDTAVGTPVVVTDDAQSAALELLVTAESSAVTIAGTPAEGDLCLFRVQRVVSDGNDDMTEDMRLIGIKLFYTTNAGNDA